MIISTESIKEYMFNSGHIKISKPLGSIDPLLEWEKWLSYELEQNNIENLEEKRKILKLIKKYNEGECSYDEYKKLSSYLNNSIDNYMISILNKDELNLAKRKINVLNKISDEDLSIKVDFEQQIDNYKKLSMVDAYVLHIISNINYNRKMKQINRSINAVIEYNKVMSKKMKKAC